MPFNGSGGTTQPASSIYPAVASTLIQSAKFNISIADIYTMLASCLLKDGQQVATQRIPFAVGISTDTINEKTSGAGVTLGQVLNTPQGADIVCAATINLETATGNVVDVTGSTGPVTAIPLSQGHWRIVRFTGTPTLTNGASLVLPGAISYTAAVGDYALFIGYAAGVVRVYTFPTNNVLGLIPQNSKSAAYTTVMSDAGKHILHPTADNNARTFTIDSNANVPYAIGTTITFVNQINTLSIAITSDTMTLASAGTTGTRTLAANGIATAMKIASANWLISGVGLA